MRVGCASNSNEARQYAVFQVLGGGTLLGAERSAFVPEEIPGRDEAPIMGHRTPGAGSDSEVDFVWLEDIFGKDMIAMLPGGTSKAVCDLCTLFSLSILNFEVRPF
jgi:hypothetical protein